MDACLASASVLLFPPLFVHMLLFALKVLVAAFGLLLLREVRLAMASIRAQRWRTAAGFLVDRGLSSRDVQDAEGFSLKGLRYGFSAEGKDYRSSQLGFGYPAAAERIFARRVIDSVLVNAPAVEVFYNPRNPDISVLVRGFLPFHMARLAGVFVCLAIVCTLVLSQ